MAVVATEKEADQHLWKKQKLAEEDEEKGVNPLDPRLSDYDPKQKKYIYTRFFYRSNLDLDQECVFVSIKPTPFNFPIPLNFLMGPCCLRCD